jgi:BirA family transcriptional regulator, biotin operon repressor / biotin---[acetyl-CoA-carboxylase] ligase
LNGRKILSDNCRRILEILRNSMDFVSGEEMSIELGVTRSAVWKSVGRLREQGYTIDAVSNRGYRLSDGIDLPISDEIHRYLQTSEFGNEIVYMQTVDSTNRLAMTLASQGAAHGTVVTADQQTDGKGRMGRKWISPPGRNLYLSLILRPDVSPGEASQIPVLSVIASIRALERSAPSLSLGIKWPNDIYCQGRKISGTLCEMKAEIDRVNHVVVGTGINVNMNPDGTPIKELATSMLIQTGKKHSRVQLAAILLEEFELVYNRWLSESNLDFIVKEWNSYSLLMDMQVDVRTNTKIVTGKAVGIADTGALMLKLPDGSVRHMYAGDASLHGSFSGI